jgi:cytochrome c553
MRSSSKFLLFPLLLACTLALGSPRQVSSTDPPAWAFPMPDKTPVAHIDETPLKQVPGSTQTYDHPEIDPYNPPDWFPDEHSAEPPVVRKGGVSGSPVQACSYCHLANGLGHPQSANLAGLPVQYFLDQIADFKSGARKAPPMDAIAKGLSDEDAKAAADWFTALKPTPWVKVVETDMAPKTLVINTRLRLPVPDGGTEPLGDRIVEVPEFPQRALSYDPNAGFIAYVPKGSIAKGEALVKTGGGKTLPCLLCHGAGLRGSDLAPRIAGRSAIYIVRQLFSIQTSARNGANVDPMKQVAATLDEKDMIAIAAYVTSRDP